MSLKKAFWVFSLLLLFLVGTASAYSLGEVNNEKGTGKILPVPIKTTGDNALLGEE